jgi:hypothetical protein
MGEDVGRYGGCFAVSKGLLDEFGPERIRDTSLSESAFVGAGIGASICSVSRGQRWPGASGYRRTTSESESIVLGRLFALHWNAIARPVQSTGSQLRL